MKNKMSKRIIGIAAAVILSAAFSVFAFAEDYFASDESEKVSVPAYIESVEIVTEGVSIPVSSEAKTYRLTPDGNLSLVDDYAQSEAVTNEAGQQSKEFLTVTTKSGNTFYIIVDRDGSTENVHFLNMVDEADLAALLGGEMPTTVMSTEATTEAETDKTETVNTSENKSGGAAVAAVMLILAGGGFAFYKFVLKPKDTKPKKPKKEESEG